MDLNRIDHASFLYPYIHKVSTKSSKHVLRYGSWVDGICQTNVTSSLAVRRRRVGRIYKTVQISFTQAHFPISLLYLYNFRNVHVPTSNLQPQQISNPHHISQQNGPYQNSQFSSWKSKASFIYQLKWSHIVYFQMSSSCLHGNFTWLTVVPKQPCMTICNIFVSGGSCLRALCSSLVFFMMSSMATSIGDRITCRTKVGSLNHTHNLWPQTRNSGTKQTGTVSINSIISMLAQDCIG